MANYAGWQRLALGQQRQLRRLTAFVATGDTSRKLEQLTSSLDFAIESAEYVSTSAEQAFLETDPAERSPKEAYVLRYAEYGLQEVHAALGQHAALKQELGDAALRSFSLRHADTLLAGDKLRSCIKSAERALQRREQLHKSTGPHERP